MEFWAARGLAPWVHYVPVSEDLSDLLERVSWAITNDAAARRIAEQAHDFARIFLSQEANLNYFRHVLVALRDWNASGWNASVRTDR